MPAAAHTKERLIALDAIERCANVSDKAQMAQIFLETTKALGFEFASIFADVDLREPPENTVMLNQLPFGWIDRVVEQSYQTICPILRACEAQLSALDWNEAAFCASLTPKQVAYMNELREHGVFNGKSLTALSPGGWTTTYHLIRGRNSVAPDAFAAGFAVANFVYSRLQGLAGEPRTLNPRLSPRQTECVYLAGRGKTDWEIGEILGISEHTAHRMIEVAKRRLNVTTRMQAVIKALHFGYFSAGDLMSSPTLPGRS